MRRVEEAERFQLKINSFKMASSAQGSHFCFIPILIVNLHYNTPLPKPTTTNICI